MHQRKKVTPPNLIAKKANNEKITMLTAYDFSMAGVLDEAGVDTILVGDSLGMVVLGYENTVPVSMEEMIHHCRAVKRGMKYALLIGDMPFMSYQVSLEEAKRNAGRFLKEGGCDAVKLEGGLEMVNTIKGIVNIGIPVVGHIGLTPQIATSLGGFKVQGKDLSSAQYQLDSAMALEEAGASLIVLECIPDSLAKIITENISIPTIGIGSGPHCDGQVLVINDLLGLFNKFIPRFVKQYAKLYPIIEDAIKLFIRDVLDEKFPSAEHSFEMDDNIITQLKVPS
ncbi:MAG: 3-methyl-2-oxobutanoate hydroxymethyltransferase [Spirochaetota bacterium]|nr:3-methyl-2-oxobutanoate hydroxymethyltransferase [Spirochaetota bacterium]